MKKEMEVSEIKNVSIAKSIEQGILLRVKAAELQSQADKCKEEANTLLEPLLGALEANKVKSNLGTVSLYTSTRKSFNFDGFKEELVRKAVPTDVIANAERNNTTVTSGKPTVRFTPKKEGK